MEASYVQAVAERWKGKRVAVVGDLILDRYSWGSASRISPEAPVPIVVVDHTSVSPGGAANALRNIACLGAQAAAFGVVGGDANAQDLRNLLHELSIDLSGVLVDEHRRTTEKTRIIAGNQQVVRVDTEDVHPLAEMQEQELAARLEAEVSAGRIDAIIIEDYAKGALSRTLLAKVASLAHRHAIPAALDPHPAHAQFVTPGLSLITPNRREAFAMAGVYYTELVLPIEQDEPLLRVVDALRRSWNAEQTLITLGPGGMALFRESKPPLHIPTRAKEVFDVSGAGDTVIASYILALLGGAPPEDAAIISNHAAGVVVGKIGTAPVCLEELLQSF